MMINDLQQKLDDLKESQQQLRQERVSLHEKLFVAYNRWVLAELEGLVGAEKIPVQLAQALQGFLNKNWSLVNGTCLSPTAIPGADVTELLCSLAEFVALNPSSDEHLSALKVLMPSINGESYRDGYDSLDKMPLRDVIRTHSLGRHGLFLVPIQLLTEIDIENPDTRILKNPYYDGEVGELYIINDDELNRLISHHSLTRALGEALRRYDVLSNDRSNLLGQLQLLCRHLQLNSAHGGRGVEENAASGAYVPIIEFNDYYTQLDELFKKKIPEPLKAEIDKLLNLASNPKANTKATENIETCIATRREQLVQGMRHHEETLSAITISPGQKSGLVAQAKARVIELQHELQTVLSTNQYRDGHDDLGLNVKLLETLGVMIAINTPSDLKALEKLSVEELDDVLTSDLLRASMVETLGSLERLIMYVIETSVSKVEIIMRRCAGEIIGCFIKSSEEFGSAQNFSAILIPLSFEKCTAVCQGMQAHLPGIMKTGGDFMEVLENLTTEQRTVVFQAMQERLPGMIKTGGDFMMILQPLALEQRTVVFQAMQAHLPEIIKNVDDFMWVLRPLTTEQRTVVFQAMQGHWPNIIKNVYYFIMVLSHLPLEQRTVVFDTMQALLPGMIKTSFDFMNVLHNLTTEQRTVIFQAMQAHLPGIIKTSYAFIRVFRHLTSEQRTVIFEAIQERLPGMIHSADDFSNALKYLNPEQSMALLQSMLAYLPRIVNNISLMRVMQAHLPGMIKTGDDFIRVFRHQTSEQRTVVFEVMQAHLSGIIKTGYDFMRVLQLLTPEQRTVVFEAMPERLPGMIKTGYDFMMILQPLAPEQRTVVFEAMQERLPGMIKTGDDFMMILQPLASEQRTVVFEAMPERLPGMIKTSYDFMKVLQLLTPEQRTVVFEVMQKRLPAMIKISFDFMHVLHSLTTEQRTVVFEAMQKHLPGIIETSDAFMRVLQLLTSEQRTVIFEAIQERLPSMIHSAYCFRNVLRYLNPEQGTIICQSLRAYLPFIIKTAKDLALVLNYLNPKQCATVYQALKPHLFDEILRKEVFMEMIASFQDAGKQLTLIGCLARDMFSVKDQARFQTLWRAPLTASHGVAVDSIQLRVAKVLNDYTDGESSLKQILFFHGKRRYVSAAASLVRDIQAGRVEKEDDLERRLVDVLLSKGCNFKGYFFKCIGFIAAQLQQSPSVEVSPDMACSIYTHST